MFSGTQTLLYFRSSKTSPVKQQIENYTGEVFMGQTETGSCHLCPYPIGQNSSLITRFTATEAGKYCLSVCSGRDMGLWPSRQYLPTFGDSQQFQRVLTYSLSQVKILHTHKNALVEFLLISTIDSSLPPLSPSLPAFLSLRSIGIFILDIQKFYKEISKGSILVRLHH